MKKSIVFGALIGLGLITAGCNTLNPLNTVFNDIETYDIVVEKDGAEILEVVLNLGVGDLNVNGGSSEWVTGEAEYNNQKFEPIVSYDLDGNTGEVEIKQKKNISINSGNSKNTWDIELNEDIPMELNVNAGASDTTLDLSGIYLTELTVDAGVGDIEVDLSGNWQESFDATINTGVGETTVILPKEIGVKVIAEQGIGKSNFNGFISKGNDVYVNDAYESADVIITVNVETGVGEANFKLK